MKILDLNRCPWVVFPRCEPSHTHVHTHTHTHLELPTIHISTVIVCPWKPRVHGEDRNASSLIAIVKIEMPYRAKMVSIQTNIFFLHCVNFLTKFLPIAIQQRRKKEKSSWSYSKWQGVCTMSVTSLLRQQLLCLLCKGLLGSRKMQHLCFTAGVGTL